MMLGVQTLALILLACALEYVCPRAREKRRLWQVVIVLVGCLVMFEVMGIGVWLHPGSPPSAPSTTFAPASSIAAAALRSIIRPDSHSPSSQEWLATSAPSNFIKNQLGLALGITWLIGAVVLFIGLIIVHALLAHIGRQLLPLMTPGQTARIQSLARQQGIRWPVRVGYRTAAQAPYVFGIWQPTLVLPREFPPSLTSHHQDAVFVHELAHLAGRDPLWQFLCDLLVVLLWWHPAAWLMRLRWRQATETVADEATIRCADGPFFLAESLLAWQQLPAWWRPGLAMLPRSKSWLTHRIHHLLSINPADDAPDGRQRLLLRWVRTSVLVFVVMTVMIGTSYARLHTVREDEPMLSYKMLRHSVLGLAFLAATESTAPAQGQIVQGGVASRSVTAAGKSEDGAVLAIDLNQAELAQFNELRQEQAKKMTVFRQLGNGPERLEAGRALGVWYRESLQNILSPEQYSRYLEYWQFNHVSIKFEEQQGKGPYTVSVSPHPFDADPTLLKGMKLSDEQNAKLTALRGEIARSYVTMNNLIKDPKGLGEFETTVATLHKQRNEKLKAILSAEQYQQYRAAMNTLMQANMAALSSARSGSGSGIAAPIK